MVTIHFTYQPIGRKETQSVPTFECVQYDVGAALEIHVNIIKTIRSFSLSHKSFKQIVFDKSVGDDVIKRFSDSDLSLCLTCSRTLNSHRNRLLITN